MDDFHGRALEVVTRSTEDGDPSSLVGMMSAWSHSEQKDFVNQDLSLHTSYNWDSTVHDQPRSRCQIESAAQATFARGQGVGNMWVR